MLEEISKIVEEDVSFTQKILNINSNPTDSEIENFKCTFSNYIQNTKYDYNYFIGLLKYFAKIRPKHKYIVPKLYETIISIFPTNKTDIENEVQKTNEYHLLYILCYPNEKHINEEETKLQLFSYLENDE